MTNTTNPAQPPAGVRWQRANRSPSPVAPRPGSPDHVATPPTSKTIITATPETFGAALQDAVDKGQVFKLDYDITIDQPITIDIRYSHRGWFGLDGQHHKIYSTVTGAPALTFTMPTSLHGVCARGFYLGNLTMLGNLAEEGGLKIDAQAEDSWLVDAHLENIWLENFGGKAALTCRGNLFESSWYDVSTQDNAGAGLYFANAGGAAVASAIRLFGGTQRQNGGAGYLVDAYDGPGDIRLHGLYFCLNRGGGIVSWAGCELIHDCGFENNTDFGINVQNYCTMNRCTGSTMGTQPQLVIGYLANPWSITDCSMVGYAGADPSFGTFTGNGQRLTFRGRYDTSRISIGSGVDAVFAP